MIRNWLGSVTDDEFYEACDKYGIMVWDDFWINSNPNLPYDLNVFNNNMMEKIKRVRNHPSIAVWCGDNESNPQPPLEGWMAENIRTFDGGDRYFQANSHAQGLTGSGPWGAFEPRFYFTKYPDGLEGDPARGWGFRTEIGTAVVPTFESFKKFMPKENWWPRDEMWNKHYFGQNAFNAAPDRYDASITKGFGKPEGIEDYCRKAQLVNIESNKAMYEGWLDRMWEDASGIMTWMGQSAYPSMVWQTYDYYYDPTGAYWGAKKACEPFHIQWNASNNSIKVINTTAKDLKGAIATATIYDLNGKEVPAYGQTKQVDVVASNIAEAFSLNFNPFEIYGEKPKEIEELTPLHFIKLELIDAKGNLISENFYWRNGVNDLDYTLLNTLPEVALSCRLVDKSMSDGKMKIVVKNNSGTVAFANRVRLVNKATQKRILPIIMSDNYVTLMPGEEKVITMEATPELLKGGVSVLVKQYGKAEKNKLDIAD